MTVRSPSTAAPPDLGRDAGASLLITLFGLVLLTVLGFGLTGIGTRATVSTMDERDAIEALAIADAGIAHARKLILWQEWLSLDQFLQNAGGTACDGDELSVAPTAPLPAGYPTAAADFIPAAGRPFGRGQYQVFVCDDHLTDTDLITGILDVNPSADVNKRIIVRSVGTGANGATVTVEQVIGAQPAPAVLVNGPLSVPGSPNVNGAAGSIHSNGPMTLEGNPCASLYYSTVTTVTVGGRSAGSGATCSSANIDTRADSPPMPVPLMDPNTYKAQATVWLESNGLAYSPVTGLPIPTPPGWSFSNMIWSSNSNIGGGTYWVNANVVMGGSPGSPASPLPLTILSNYSIDVGGSPSYVPSLIVTGPGMPVPTGLGMIAATDLLLRGNSGQTHNGMFYAGHQLNVSGSPTINGQIMAANLADTPYLPGARNIVQLDGAGRMVVTGSPTINFNGNGIVSTGALAWRECRDGMNPANPCGPLWGGNP